MAVVFENKHIQSASQKNIEIIHSSHINARISISSIRGKLLPLMITSQHQTLGFKPSAIVPARFTPALNP